MKRRKPYAIERSPLYKLRSRGRLCAILGTTRDNLPRLQSDESYRVFRKAIREKERTIEEPIGSLKKTHKRLHALLSRIECPEWCFSGVRGRSHISHARHHSAGRYLIACDIHSFYPSTRKEYVFRFLHYAMLQAEDIAWLLADITTYDGHLPTGSPSSPLLAFRAYEPMFSTLEDLAANAGAEFTVYVDDMTLTSPAPLPGGLLAEMNRIIRSYGLELKRSKTRFCGPAQWKKVTGAAISPDGRLEIPNRIRHEIHRYSRTMRQRGLVPSEIRRLHGLLTEAQQIDPGFGTNLMPCVLQLLRSSRS